MQRVRRTIVLSATDTPNSPQSHYAYTPDGSDYQMSLHSIPDSDDESEVCDPDGVDSSSDLNHLPEGGTPIVRVVPAPPILPEVLFHEQPAPAKPLLTWSRRDVIQWLGSLGSAYTIYAKTFYDNGIDGKMLNDINDDDLRSLNVRNLHRKKIMIALREVTQISSRRVSFRKPPDRTDGFDTSFSPRSSFGNSRSRTLSRPSNASSIASPKPLNANQKEWNMRRSFSMPTQLETTSTYAAPVTDTISIANRRKSLSPGSGSASRKNSMESQVSSNGRKFSSDALDFELPPKYGSPNNWDTTSLHSHPSFERSRHELPRVNSRPSIPPYHQQAYNHHAQRGRLTRMKPAYSNDLYEEHRFSQSSERSVFYDTLSDPDSFSPIAAESRPFPTIMETRKKAHSYSTPPSLPPPPLDARRRGGSVILNETYRRENHIGELSPVTEENSVFARSMMRSDPTMQMPGDSTRSFQYLPGRGRRVSVQTDGQSETTTGSAASDRASEPSTNSRYTVTNNDAPRVERHKGSSAEVPELKIFAERIGYVQVFMNGSLRWVTSKQYRKLLWNSSS